MRVCQFRHFGFDFYFTEAWEGVKRASVATGGDESGRGRGRGVAAMTEGVEQRGDGGIAEENAQSQGEDDRDQECQ